jgi:chemotaxis protein methyltransferase CheR
MSATPHVDDAAIDELVRYVLAWTGYRPDPSHDAAVRRALQQLRRQGHTMQELLEQAARGEPALMGALLSAVSVPETYFFRQPEHFAWIAAEICPRLPVDRPVRAWSAGCATGEEAYSLAACLMANLAPGAPVDVLGTDLLPRNVDIAKAGTYGPWSSRASGPAIHPVCTPASDGRAHVLEEVRGRTRFEVHNLLDAPPGSFDVILCRNVLLYFTAEATHLATEHLTRALAPDGVLLFGTLDVSGIPEGLARLGRPELNVFGRAPEQARAATARAPAPKVARRSTRPPKRGTHPPPKGGAMALLPVGSLAHVALHLDALASIERGDRRGAERELEELRRVAPDYLPGMFEHALLHIRHGDTKQAERVMRELLRRLQPLAADAVLAGPEDLTVDYYRVAARAFLESLIEGATPSPDGGRRRGGR